MKKESLSTSVPKLIMAVCLIVGVGMVLWVLWYFLVMPNETADWKTYRNEEYGFEVKYPADWKEENKKLYSPEMYKAYKNGSFSFSLEITLDTHFNSIDEELEYQGKCAENIVHYTINNKEIVGYSNACDFYKEKKVMMAVGDQIVKGLSYSFSDESKIISQILSTFKFIEK